MVKMTWDSLKKGLWLLMGLTYRGYSSLWSYLMPLWVTKLISIIQFTHWCILFSMVSLQLQALWP